MAIAWNKNHEGFDGTQTDWAGYVLEKKHDNSYQIMSDVWGSADWATVWDEATSSPKHILVNVYDMNPSGWCPVQITVDATDEIREKHKQWLINREYERLLGSAEIAARRIEKGCIAKVVKGKSGKGTIGPVVVAMNAIYGMGWRSSQELKVAIATSDVKVKKALRNGKVAEVYQDVVWAWARNVVRIDIAKIDREALWKQAQERAVRAIAA
jgi:hypothetical protein